MNVRLSPQQIKEIRDLITPEDLEEMKYAHFNVVLREQRQRSNYWHYFATEEQKEQRKRENYNPNARLAKLDTPELAAKLKAENALVPTTIHFPLEVTEDQIEQVTKIVNNENLPFEIQYKYSQRPVLPGNIPLPDIFGCHSKDAITKSLMLKIFNNVFNIDILEYAELK